MIPQDFIQTLLDRTDIVDVVQRFVPLKKAGANYQARCPFHNEKSPSFTVSPSKQFYHCFGCGAHGTAISFLMQHSGVGFVDAVKELAERAGLVVPDDGAPRQDERLPGLEARLETAARLWRARLKETPVAIDYLKRRGLSGETAARFGLGYAPDGWQGLQEVFADYDAPELVEAGLVIVNVEGRRYDRFRDRIMFPIRNGRGRLVGFGGRVIGEGTPKYLNSPETPVFHKGRELYGLHENRRGIADAGRAVVVEGYMDVVMLAQHGIQNALATLGTAVTEDQARQVLRLADAVVFAFDGDAAGRRAAWRALENSLPVLEDGKRVTFLFLPEGEDPDSFVRTQGREAWQRELERAKPLSDFLFESLTEGEELFSPEGKVRVSKKIAPYLQRMPLAPLLMRMLQKRLADLTGIAVPSPSRGMARRSPPAPASRRTALATPARIVLQALLHDMTRLSRIPRMDGEDAEIHALSGIVDLLREEGPMSVPELIDRCADHDFAPFLRESVEGMLAWAEDYDAEADFVGALQRLEVQSGRKTLQALSAKKPSELTPEERELLQAALRRGRP
jgi:DNA primase